MDKQIKLTGLNRFLATIYGGETNLESLLGSLNFDPAQLKILKERHLPAVAEGLLEVIRKRLTWEEKDLWFRILARRLGMDGESPLSTDEAARVLGIEPGYASYAEGEALQKCSSKTALAYFKKEIHRLALDELSGGGETPGKEKVIQKLERLADLQAAVDLVRMDYEAKRSEVLKRIQAELDAIDEEFKPSLEAAEANAQALEAQIKNDVLLRGESLRGGVYQAIYMKGRISWDGIGMNEYARDHPDVLKFRKEGQPSVSLRKSA
jgi:hypothetical protein